jgi:flagellar hook-associated protein 3
LKVRYPSDDAVTATRTSNLKSRLRELEQYERNIDHAENILNSYDTSLQEISSIYQRLRELITQGANGILTDEQRKAISQEVKQIKEQLIQIANTQIGTDYIFAGYASNKPPVDQDGNIVLNPDSAKSRFVNALGYRVEYGLSAKDVFQTDSGMSVFQLIDITINALESNDQETLGGISLMSMDYLEDTVSKGLAKIGADQRMVEMISTRIEDLNTFMTEYISKETDADITEVLTKLSTHQAALTAALKSAANVLTSTLVDFIE